MMTITIISLLLLVSLLPHMTFTAHVGIVDGRKAKPHSRPYMVSIQSNDSHVCGGFLITEQFVLTAAHCWNEREVLTVLVGAHKLSRSKCLDRCEVERYFNSKYKPHLNRNDIMLLKLKKKVRLSKNVGLISLPKDGEDVKADTLCSVAGWGRLWKNGPKPDRLMEANTSIVNDAECEQKWGSDYKASKMICAYGHGGSCNGDSGGPLVCNNTAVGVTAFCDRYQCNSRLLPNVYTKISAYLKWIHKVIGNM
ncbi:duodenase-1-like [Danio rerio]|uniref:Duodenase-1-like n=1 Tax=Danio rerio TaxID=7955 RepID=A0AB32TGV4_DANRE